MGEIVTAIWLRGSEALGVVGTNSQCSICHPAALGLVEASESDCQ